MIYKRFKIKWKEYPKMMPFGERLAWLPSFQKIFPKFFYIKDIILNGGEILCSLHLVNRKVDDGSLNGNIVWKSSNILKYICS
jgi:hypothetical protein